jgi:hypothetical protein
LPDDAFARLNGEGRAASGAAGSPSGAAAVAGAGGSIAGVGAETGAAGTSLWTVATGVAGR